MPSRVDVRGASAVEHGPLISCIAALIDVVFAFGGVLSNSFSPTCNQVGQSGGGSC
jgi:Flp pilus assembly pilin Flp